MPAPLRVAWPPTNRTSLRRYGIKISSFIADHREAILADWEQFADALTPDERELTAEELRDFANLILVSIIDSLEGGSSRAPDDEPAFTETIEGAAKAHAEDRLLMRFTLSQMAAEYRGLRASVARRWIESLDAIGADELQELARFDKSLDLSLAVAVAWYDGRLRKAQDELMASDRAKNEFLAVLGHELRNPLAPIRTGLDLLARARTKPELLDTLRPMMERQFSHLSRLVDDLLDIARISRGEITLQASPLDFNVAVEAAIEQLLPAVRERGHRLVVRLADEPLPVVGDFERLTEIVANLLSNACKYTDPDGRIRVSSAQEHNEAVVRIRDTGYGIPAEHIEEVFRLFNQVPEHRKLTGGGGLGVGLALSRQLIEMHGGSLEVNSEGAGHGSEFIAKLPMSGSQTDSRPTAEQHSEHFGPSRRVMVVDDNADAADTLRMLVEVMGHDVRVARDGPEALQQLEQFDPDVVLLDLGLPGMDGTEVARRIRALPSGDKVMLVAVTGWSADSGPSAAGASRQQSTREAGFDAHLTKPADARQISAVLVPKRPGK